MRGVKRAVLIYDADCRLCRFWARAALRLDRRGRLAALALQDPEAEPLLTPIPEAKRLASVRLAEPDGRLLERGDAVAATLGLRRLGPLLNGPYDLVSRHRGRLGRFVPDGPAPRRFP